MFFVAVEISAIAPSVSEPLAFPLLPTPLFDPVLLKLIPMLLAAMLTAPIRAKSPAFPSAVVTPFASAPGKVFATPPVQLLEFNQAVPVVVVL
jgi:hypothetical protein